MCKFVQRLLSMIVALVRSDQFLRHCFFLVPKLVVQLPA